MADHNTLIIEEFRSNGGTIGGYFQGAPLLLLHHTGAKTGTERISPLMYQGLEEGYAVFASKEGAPNHPDWFHNLLANPGVTVEVGSETIEVVARVTEGEERERIWEQQKSDYTNFAEYEERTDREIPVVILGPR
jgi:deazaflavin-dependent oxidoreductase (nitroreductase family)